MGTRSIRYWFRCVRTCDKSRSVYGFVLRAVWLWKGHTSHVTFLLATETKIMVVIYGLQFLPRFSLCRFFLWEKFFHLVTFCYLVRFSTVGTFCNIGETKLFWGYMWLHLQVDSSSLATGVGWRRKPSIQRFTQGHSMGEIFKLLLRSNYIGKHL